MIKDRIMSLGIDLGVAVDDAQENKYEILLDNQVIQIEKPQYDLWLAGTMGGLDVLSLSKVLEKNEDEIQLGIDQLKEKQLVVNWPDKLSSQFFKKYALIPRGYSMGMNEEGNYLLSDFPTSNPSTVPIEAYLIWMYAHPLLNLQSVSYEICQSTKIEESIIQRAMLDWVPQLISKGLVSMQHSLTGE